MIQLKTGKKLKIRVQNTSYNCPDDVEFNGYIKTWFVSNNTKQFELSFYEGNKKIALRNDERKRLNLEISGDGKEWHTLQADDVHLQDDNNKDIYTAKPDFKGAKTTQDYALLADQCILVEYLISVYPFLKGQIKSTI